VKTRVDFDDEHFLQLDGDDQWRMHEHYGEGIGRQWRRCTTLNNHLTNSIGRKLEKNAVLLAKYKQALESMGDCISCTSSDCGCMKANMATIFKLLREDLKS